MRVTFIDHYDSFSFNVLDWLTIASGARLRVERVACNDEIALRKLKNNPVPIIISPGPGKPTDYPLTLSVIESTMNRVPILGICLGHQMLGIAAGGIIHKAIDPWHGTATEVKLLSEHWLTKSLPNRFNATLYNSLIVKLTEGASDDWLTVAENLHGEIMILCHQKLPVCGIQFHPESFASTDLSAMAKNFLSLC